MKKLILLIGFIALGAFTMQRKALSMTFFNDHFDTDYDFNKYDALFIKHGNAQGVDPKLLKAIAANESVLGYNKERENIGNTGGIMHIKLTTAKDYEPDLTESELLKPDTNIRVATKHIKRLIKLFNNNLDNVVRAYNQGEGNTIRNKKFAEDYLARFKRNYKRLGVA